MCVIGIINTHTRQIRLEVSFSRESTFLEKIIRAHIKTENYFVTNCWTGYLWARRHYSGYIHNHGHGYVSTSHRGNMESFKKNTK